MSARQSARAPREPPEQRGEASLLRASVAVPRHVVYRSFPSETVVLNLQTGKYHGLNPTAGAMLAALERAACVADAVGLLAREYERPPAEIERDVRELCDALLERGLVELDGPAAS
jgi:hypothetical protein